MSHDEIQLLSEQLQASLAETPYDIVEAAGLAGLLARLSPDHAALVDFPIPQSLSADVQANLASGAERLSEAVEDCDEDTEPAVGWDRLCALDEICAAAHWLGAPELAAPHVENIHHTLSAFPEAWAAHAPAASVILQHRAPRPGDPALLLWRTVESAALGFHADTEQEKGAPGQLRVALGLDVVIQLDAFRQAARRAAASELPEPGPWQSLREADDWSAGITTEDGDIWLVIQHATGPGQPTPTVTCDGEPVALTPHVGALRCKVRPGAWRIEVGDTAAAFTLAGDA